MIYDLSDTPELNQNHTTQTKLKRKKTKEQNNLKWGAQLEQ